VAVAGGGWVGAALAATEADAVAAAGGAVVGLGAAGVHATAKAPRARAIHSLRIESDLLRERAVRRPDDRPVAAGNTCITPRRQDD